MEGIHFFILLVHIKDSETYINAGKKNLEKPCQLFQNTISYWQTRRVHKRNHTSKILVIFCFFYSFQNTSSNETVFKISIDSKTV